MRTSTRVIGVGLGLLIAAACVTVIVFSLENLLSDSKPTSWSYWLLVPSALALVGIGIGRRLRH